MAQKLDLEPIDDEPLDLEPLDLEEVSEPQAQEPTMLKQGWDAISQPLWEGPSRLAKQISEYMQPSNEAGPIQAGLQGFAQGATQGVGDVLSSMTSPIDLGTALLSGGSGFAIKKGLPAIGRGLAYGAKAGGGLVAAHGAGNVLSPDSSLAERGMGLAEIAGGIAGMHTPTPKTAGIPEPPVTASIKNAGGGSTTITSPHGTNPLVEPPITAASMGDFFTPKPEPIVPQPGGPRPGKMRVKPNGDGTFTNLDTGEVLNNRGLPVETPQVLDPTPAELFDRPENIAKRKANEDAQGGPDDLQAWAAHEHYRDAEMEAGRPDPGPYKQTGATVNVGLKPGAQYAFFQPGFEDIPGFHMYNVPLPEGGMTTVNADMVGQMGYALPEVGTSMPRPQSMPALGGIGDSIASGPLDPILTTDVNTGMKTVGRGTTNMDTSVRQIDEPMTTQMGPTMDEANGLIDQMGTNLQSLPPRGPYGDDPNFITGSPMQPRPQAALPPAPDMNVIGQKPPVTPITLPDTPVKPKRTMDPDTYHDPHAELRAEPVGTEHSVQPGTLNRKKMMDAIKLGYDIRLDDNGKIIMKKIKESPELKLMDDPNIEQSALLEIANLPRTLMASIDMSAPLRQGLGLIHKKAFWTSLPDMFKAFGSEEAYKAAQKSIFDDAMFKKRVTADGRVKKSFAEDVGLKFTDLGSMVNREEAMMSSMAGRIPGIGRAIQASNRAYTVFLNKLRADTFKQMTKDFEVFSGKNLKQDVATAKEIATFINNASGRGTLPLGLETSAKNLSAVLFSPRLIASRLNMMAKSTQALFSPEVYMMSRPSVRREYLKSLGAIAGTASAFTGMMQMAGAEVVTDPASSDFGKPRIGNTRIDPYGGFQQYIVAAQRLMPYLDLSSMGLGEIGGRMESSATEFGEEGREYDLYNPKFGQSDQEDILIRFVRSKSNPIINFGWGLLAGRRELSGKPMNFTSINPVGEQGENFMDNSVVQRFMPMLLQDVYSLVQDEVTPAPAKIAAAGLATFGMGSQTYGPE